MPGLYKHLNKEKKGPDGVWHSTPVDIPLLSSTTGNVVIEEEEMLLLSPIQPPVGHEGLLGSTINSDQSSSLDTRSTTIGGFETHDDDDQLLANMEIELQQQQQAAVQNKEPAAPPPHNNNKGPLNNGSHFVSQRFGQVEIQAPSGHGAFASILHQNGFVLTLPRNHLRHDVLMFRGQMNNWMINNRDENSRIEDGATRFVKALQKYFGIKSNLVHACSTTLNDRECVQPSLLACLLGVSVLQKPLLQVILPTLTEAACSNTQEETDFVNTLMTQMRWLPALLDGKPFADDLLRILETASIPSKKHIVRLLPEIFMPEHHPNLVPKLMEIFELGTRINVTILDCFASLVIPDEDCIKTRRSAVEMMTSALLEDLPAYISFLFRVGSPVSHLEEGIREMRGKLEIKSRSTKQDVFMMEILERIRFFVSVNPLIVKTWLIQLKDDLDMELDLKPIDLLLLLVFVETSHKAAINVLTAVFINRSKLILQLFDNMMEHNNQMLHELFPTIAKFLDTILRSKKNSKCHDAAAKITKKLFVGLGPLLSQHLTSNLIGILINGHPMCRDVILQIFTAIAETDAHKLLYFHSYLMGALSFVMKYPPRQMGALMNILALLAYIPQNIQGEENAFTAEFMILLRKQITHGNIRSRCFGVLGTIAAIKQLALHSGHTNTEKIDGLLALAWSSIENDEEACSIFFDEMISCVKVLPKDVCVQFRDILKLHFERLWTRDQATASELLQTSKGQAGLDLIPTFDANKEMIRDQLIIVLEPQALQMSPLVVPSHLRVMAELEKGSENDLDGIDALIGCPIFFPQYSVYYGQEDLTHLNYNQRFHLGQYLVITLNYFRECVSAFVGIIGKNDNNHQLGVKVWIRLQNIVSLQKSLVKHLHAFPNLPLAYGTQKTMSDASSSQSPGFSGGLKSAKPKKTMQKTKKKKKNDDFELNLEQLIQPNLISPYLRRLDLTVFNMLMKFPLNPMGEVVDYNNQVLIQCNSSSNNATQQSDDSIIDMSNNKIEQLSPETLTLLLSEIKRQALDKTFSNSNNFKIFLVEDLLASLCQHVETISNFYKQPQQDDEEDLDDINMKHVPAIDTCLRLLFNTMNLYFETVLKQEKAKQAQLVQQIMLTLQSRCIIIVGDTDDIDMEGDSSQIELLRMASKYFLEFGTLVGPTDYQTALEHVKLLKNMHDLIPGSDGMFKKCIGKAVKSYLRRDWALPSSFIVSFLKTWLSVASCPLKIMTPLVELLIGGTELDKSVEIPQTSVYHSCNKNNFHAWYATIFQGLAQDSIKWARKGNNNMNDSIMVQRWTNGNKLFRTLVEVSVEMKESSILIPLLKFSRLYIEALMSGGGVAITTELWKQRKFDEGEAFNLDMQKSTRKIQSICEHAKVSKDNLLLRHVPPMKKTLEKLIFKVRETVATLGITNVFSLGKLKHRNLDGEVINSQPFNHSSEDQEESEVEVQVEEDNDCNGNVLQEASDEERMDVDSYEVVEDDMSMDDDDDDGDDDEDAEYDDA